MRLLITLVLILSAIISGSLWISESLQVSADELTGQINLVSGEIENKKWDNAVSHMQEMERKWHNKAKWWPIFLDHQEIDHIEFSLAKAKEYVTNQDRTLALGQLSELKLMIEHIPLNEKVTLKNIL